MLTRRGRSVLVMALGCFVTGRLFALRELYMLSGALGVILLRALMAGLSRPANLEVRRGVTPPRLSAGNELRVDLQVTNMGRFGAGPLLLEDRAPARLGVSPRLALPSLPRGHSRRLAYVLRPDVRGRYELGPLDVAFTDPFGLVQRRKPASGTSVVIVHPAFERIHTLALGAERAGAVRRSPMLGQGDEFYALRQYRDGDDLRKVHWPSSLRLGEMVVRQEELRREPGVVILLDTCAAKHRGVGAESSMEAAVSACASVAALAVSWHMPVSVMTPRGPLLPDRRPSEPEILEALALHEPGTHASMLPALTRVPSTGGGFLVVVTPGLSPKEASRVAEIARGSAGGICVLLAAFTFEEPETHGLQGERDLRAALKTLTATGMPSLVLRAGEWFDEVWETGVRRVAVAR
jgi:uncharacterized protein (DUF58 family)